MATKYCVKMGSTQFQEIFMPDDFQIRLHGYSPCSTQDYIKLAPLIYIIPVNGHSSCFLQFSPPPGGGPCFTDASFSTYIIYSVERVKEPLT
jgi:hypothetical protein